MCVIVSCHSSTGIAITDSERVWQDRSSAGTETTKQNRHTFSVDTHRASVLSCRPLTTSEGTSSVRARHTRGRRRPLGPEGLATLALRTLNRQPPGVLARNSTTFRLPPPWRAYERQDCRQTETGVGLTVYAKADSNRREPLPAKVSEAVVAGLPRSASARGRQRGEMTRPTGTTPKDQ